MRQTSLAPRGRAATWSFARHFVKRVLIIGASLALLGLVFFYLRTRARNFGGASDGEIASVEAPNPSELPPGEIDVFAVPRLIAGGEQGMAVTQRLFGEGKYGEAEGLLSAMVRAEPRIGSNHYNLACALALQGKSEPALKSLRAAIEHGFRDVKHIAADSDLRSLHGLPEFQTLLELAKTSALPATPPQVAPARIRDGIALVGKANTAIYSPLGVLYSSFEFNPKDPRSSATAVKGHGKAGELVRQWQHEGHAAGLYSVLYDNRDRDHSTLGAQEFPQLTFVEYSDEARREGLDHGLQVRFLYNLPTLGNSSTAQTGGGLWRSQARSAQSSPSALGVQYQEYFSNQLYVYPEHRDYDSGHNGSGGGWGDVFPAHTPYCLITRGSSGSDLPMLRALALTIAAFRPETRERLVSQKMLAPTLQAILRRCYRPVRSDDDYFTGRAHPLAFDVTLLDPERMVRMAQAMPAEEVPPVVRMTVKEEDGPTPGAQYFDATPGEVLFDSACAVARVWHRAARTWRMVINTEASVDANGRPLTYRWALLQGDPAKVQIVTLTPKGSVAELRVTWHDRFVVSPEDNLASNRVDIAVFASNGVHWSAPAFVTFFCPDSVSRRYDASGRLESIEFRSTATGGNYADPLVHTPRDWRDELHYDDTGHLLGWSRHRGGSVEDFTSDGYLVSEKDQYGRATLAREVRYIAESHGTGGPYLRQITGETAYRYDYISAEDRRGRVTRLDAAPRSARTP